MTASACTNNDRLGVIHFVMQAAQHGNLGSCVMVTLSNNTSCRRLDTLANMGTRTVFELMKVVVPSRLSYCKQAL
eukprot:3242-Heterococcus_DN1.PRE.3